MVDSRGTRGVVGPFGGGHVEGTLVIFGSDRVSTKSANFWGTNLSCTLLLRTILRFNCKGRRVMLHVLISAFNDDVRYVYICCPKQEGRMHGKRSKMGYQFRMEKSGVLFLSVQDETSSSTRRGG